MEVWDLLDKNGNKTGESIEKTAILPDGLYHLGVDIWIKNDDGKYLIQKRAVTKKRMPGKWMVTGGSVLSGENGIQAVIRETMEEIGVNIGVSQLKLLFRNRFNDCINEVWLLKQNIQISSIKMQPDEVSDVKLVNKEKIVTMITDKEMVNYGTDYLKSVFEEKVLNHMLIEAES